jgi:hypothetical protein
MPVLTADNLLCALAIVCVTIIIVVAIIKG